LFTQFELDYRKTYETVGDVYFAPHTQNYAMHKSFKLKLSCKLN